MFLKGLKENGVPLKYCSWHTNIGTLNGSTINFAVQERNRSIKSIFALQKRQGANYQVDNGAALFDTSVDGLSTLQNFQFRVGARYFPASPVQTADQVGGSKSNGGAEAFIELQKALNTVGDYRLQTNVNMKNWALQPLSMSSGVTPLLPEYDYSIQPTFALASGNLSCVPLESTTNGFCGTLPPSMFAMASSFETSNGMEISGLNAEEQSDISVLAYWKSPQGSAIAGGNTNLEVYTFFDAMMVLRENNVVELIY